MEGQPSLAVRLQPARGHLKYDQEAELPPRTISCLPTPHPQVVEGQRAERNEAGFDWNKEVPSDTLERYGASHEHGDRGAVEPIRARQQDQIADHYRQDAYQPSR